MTLPEWLPEITSDRVGAAGDLATALAFVLALLIYAHDRLDKRRAQAEQVSAWFAYDGSPQHWGDDDLWQLHVRNASDRPIYDVLAMPARGVSDHAAWTVIAPDATRVESVGGTIADGLEAMTGGGVSIDYTDSAGRRWRRTPDGRLHRWRRWHGRPTNPETRRSLRATLRGEDDQEVEPT